MVADVEGEPSEAQDITEGHAQAESPKKDAEADAIIERAEVSGSEFRCLGTCVL
jgi:hypothetical protein